MRTLALRRFNSDIETLDEPVQVSLTRGGEVVILGTFYPTGTMSLASTTTPTVEAVYTAPLTQTKTVPGPDVVKAEYGAAVLKQPVTKPTVHQILSKVNTKTK